MNFRGKILIVGIVLMGLSCRLPPQLFPNPQDKHANLDRLTELTEKAISEDPILKKLDDMCTQIKKPDGFVFAYKEHFRPSIPSQTYLITHKYGSEMNFEKVRNFFAPEMESNGWVIDEEVDIGGRWVEFVKDGYALQVYYGGSPRDKEGKFIYSLSCEFGNWDK